MVNDLSQWNWWYWQSPADMFETWRWLNWLLRGVALVLLVMLTQVVLTTATAVARHVAACRQSRRFVSETKDLRDRGLESAIAAAMKFHRSHVAAVVAAGLQATREFPRSLRDDEARGCVERAMNRMSAMRAAEIRGGLGILKTIAETAPLVGAFGALLGILEAFRGGSGSRWSWLMVFAGTGYIALIFAALGLLVAVLSMWAHRWMEQRSRALAQEMKDTAFDTMKCLKTHTEWRDAGSIDARDSTLCLSEVTYDRLGAVLVAVGAFELYFFYLVIHGVWWSSSTDAGYAFALGICLLAAGVIAFSMWLTRHGRTVSAAGQDACVGPRFYHWSIERRREARLPLRERLAALPDRSAVFGVPLLTLLAVMAFLNSIPSPVGIPVEVVSQAPASVRERSQQPLVLQVQGVPGANLYTGPPLLRLQKKLINENELRGHLKTELARREDKSVFIYGDRDLPFQSVAKAMDVVSGLGGRPVLIGSAKLK